MVIGRKVIFQIGSDGHLGFMQITRVAQSCHLGNKAEFFLEPHYITNHLKMLIGKNFSRFGKCQID